MLLNNYEGHVIKAEHDDKLYLIMNGKKHRIPNLDMYCRLYEDDALILVLKDDVVRSCPEEAWIEESSFLYSGQSRKLFFYREKKKYEISWDVIENAKIRIRGIEEGNSAAISAIESGGDFGYKTVYSNNVLRCRNANVRGVKEKIVEHTSTCYVDSSEIVAYCNMQKILLPKEASGTYVMITGDRGGCFQAEVSAKLYDKNESLIESVENDNLIVEYVDNTFLFLADKGAEKEDGIYYLVTQFKPTEMFCIEMQSVFAEVVQHEDETEQFLRNQIGEFPTDDEMPIISRPFMKYMLRKGEREYKETEPEQSQREPLALWGGPFIYALCSFLGVSNPVVAVAIVGGAATLAIVGICTGVYVAMRKGDESGKIDEIEKMREDQIEKYIQEIERTGKFGFSEPKAEDKDPSIYTPEEIGYRRYNNIKDITDIKSKTFAFLGVDSTIWDLYNKYVDEVAGTHIIKDIGGNKWITKQLLEEYGCKELIVDVGGEGYFKCDGMKAGSPYAINLNGKVNNSQRKSAMIPMLLRVSDWCQDRFPFAHDTVKEFHMSGCGVPTRMTTIQMMRCIRKDKNAKIKFGVIKEEKSFTDKFQQLMEKVFSKEITMTWKENAKVSDFWNVEFSVKQQNSDL